MKNALFFLFLLTSLHLVAQNKTIKENKVVFTANYGLANRVGEIGDNLSAEQKKYIKNIKSGSSFDLGLYYKVNSNQGVGLKFNHFGSTAPNVVPVDDVIFYLTGKQSINFYGLSYILDGKSRTSKHEGFIELGLGYLDYKESMANDFASIISTGGTLGISAGIGYKYSIASNISIGPQLNFIAGTLSQFNIAYPDGTTETIELEDETKESLARIDVVLAVCFRI